MPLTQIESLLEMLADGTPIEDILERVGVEPIVVVKWLYKEGHIDIEEFFPDMDNEYED